MEKNKIIEELDLALEQLKNVTLETYKLTTTLIKIYDDLNKLN